MLLAPLMPFIDPSNPPTIFGVSGYSGAGTKTGENDEHGRPKTVPKIVSQDPCFTIVCCNLLPLLKTAEDLKGAIRPYSLTDHIHEREASYRLSQLFTQPLNSPFQLAFVPNVAPWFSGIISVLSAPLKQSMRADEIWKLYEEKYANEPLVKIQKSVPDVTEAEGKHGWRVGGVQVHSSGKRVVVVVSQC